MVPGAWCHGDWSVITTHHLQRYYLKRYENHKNYHKFAHFKKTYYICTAKTVESFDNFCSKRGLTFASSKQLTL